MLFGYARVSSADQNPTHQVDALRLADVDVENIHIDHSGGANASLPQLDAVLTRLRGGDTLVITRWDRLGCSVPHLITLGADLRDRGIGLHVLEQRIDTATAEGRAMFRMLSVLAELQRCTTERGERGRSERRDAEHFPALPSTGTATNVDRYRARRPIPTVVVAADSGVVVRTSRI
jgi:DNA invertase Pin-like site-specific DNA recombinase